MKVAIVLLLAIFAGTQAKNIPPTGDLFSRFEPHIRSAADQQDATKLCAIREELERGDVNSNKVQVIEFLDKTASSKFPFDATACSKEIDMDSLEKTEESTEKFEPSSPETEQNSRSDTNAVSFLKEFEMGDFAQDGKTIKDLSTPPILSDSLDVQSILEPITDVLSSGVTEEENDDLDKFGMDNSISNSDQFECPGCKKEMNNDMAEFTSTLDDKEQTSADTSKLIGMVVGLVFVAIVLLIIIGFLIYFCCFSNRRSETLPSYHDQTPSYANF